MNLCCRNWILFESDLSFELLDVVHIFLRFNLRDCLHVLHIVLRFNLRDCLDVGHLNDVLREITCFVEDLMFSSLIRLYVICLRFFYRFHVYTTSDYIFFKCCEILYMKIVITYSMQRSIISFCSRPWKTNWVNSMFCQWVCSDCFHFGWWKENQD
jgi:hypothetical protein